jgi:hypothetical protein
VVNELVATFDKDWVSTGFDEISAAVKADAAAARPATTAKATQALAKEMPPLKTTVKKAIKQAVTRAGKKALAHGELKATVKDAVKKAVKEAVKEIAQQEQGL